MKRNLSAYNAPLEDVECQDFHKWLEERGILHEHIPNESRSSKKDAAIRGRKLKSMGLSAGYWDYDVYIPVQDLDGKVGGYELIKIEMKRARKNLSTVSLDQKKWGKVYELAGIESRVCYGAEKAEEFVEEVYERINQKKLCKKHIDF